MRNLFVTAFLSSSLLFGQAPSDPAAWWTFDESTGTVAADSGPYANTGLLTGFLAGNWVTGQLGNALQFNGTSEFVTVTPIGPGLPIQLRPLHSFTAWVRGPAQGDRRIYSEGDNVNLNPLFTVGSAGNGTTPSAKLRVFVRAPNGGNRLDAVSVGDVFDNTWHHVAWVDSAGRGRLYVDGVLDSEWAYDVPNFAGSLSRVAVGAVLRATAGNFFSGAVDDLRLFPFCLTATDVNLIRLSGAPLPGGFQLNQPGASLDLNGEQGSPATPAVTLVSQGSPFTLRLSSTQVGFPWELVGAAASPVANLLPASQNILNVNYQDPSAFFLNAGFASTFGNSITLPGLPPPASSLTLTLNFTAPLAPVALSLQFGTIDPTSPDGIRLSQPAQLSVP